MNDEELRPLYLLHNQNSSTFNARWTHAQILEEELVLESAEEEPESADEADEVEPVTSQP
jgi:hypothetical protein